MKINQKIMIYGQKVILVPYRKSHVAKYHKWMECPELRELTSSERLTLEQEYEMQITWMNDEDKCTFIILDRESYDKTKDEEESMIGDVNLYILGVSGDIGELGLMIAEEKFRRGGRGLEAVSLMMRYCDEELDINQFIVKISFSNEISIRLFQDKLAFVVTGCNDIFQEKTLEKHRDTLDNDCYDKYTSGYKIIQTQST